MNIRNSIALLVLGLLLSCAKNDLIGPQQAGGGDTVPASGNYKGVFIINEGNFQWGNASISFYDPEKKTVTNNLFSEVNGRPLGDVAQSMAIYNGKGYIVVDNSGKTEVVDMTNFKSTGTITGLVSPRYFAVAGPGKAYITEIYGEHVSVVDLNTLQRTKKIDVSGWTEQLVVYNGKAFIANMDSSEIVVADTGADTVIAVIATPKGPNSLLMDKNNKLWVLCSGGFSEENAALLRINPLDYNIEQTFTFSDIGSSPGKLAMNGTLDTLYYLNSGIYRMSITDAALSSVPVVPAEGRLFYGLGIDPQNSDIYAADAVDYVQQGMVYRYSAAAEEIDSFIVGIIPGAFVFN